MLMDDFEKRMLVMCNLLLTCVYRLACLLKLERSFFKRQ